jgi:predicted nucleic acid-binding protein
MAAAWCFPDERTAETQGLLQDLAGQAAALAPRLLAYEIRSVVVKGIRRERIGRDDAQAFLDSFAALRIRLLDPPYDEVLRTALRYDLSYYDAAYLELALREGLPLATLDKRLHNAAGAAGAILYRKAT